MGQERCHQDPNSQAVEKELKLLKSGTQGVNESRFSRRRVEEVKYTACYAKVSTSGVAQAPATTLRS